MYVRLKDEYALRGWKGIPWGLVNTKTATVNFLSAECFNLFEYLDGEINLDLVLMTSAQRENLAEIIEQGVAVSLEQPRPIGEFQRYKKTSNYYLEAIHWSITGGCNLRCKHCYMGAPRHKYPDLDTEQCFRIIRQMADANVVSVSITGGEPLTRPDFWQIVDKFTGLGIAVRQLYTNGLLIDDAFFENLEKRDFADLEFVLSFDCVGCHDWMRGASGAEEKTIRIIRRLREKNYKVSVETALYDGNIDQLLPTYELLKDMGVYAWKTGSVFNSGEWREQGQEALDMKTLYRHYRELIKRYMDDGQPLTLQLDGFFMGNPSGGKIIPYVKPLFPGAALTQHSCLSCRIHPYLLPDGRLLPCPAFTGASLEQDMPNLRDAAIGEIYSEKGNPFFSVVNIRTGEVIAHNKECGICEHRLECRGGCRGAAVSCGNGLLGKDAAICRFFKEGYRAEIEKLIGKKENREVEKIE
jgi:radical SAM protein with 4Fe4S-binding SPASM domain